MRTCTTCNELMDEGYLAEEIGETYCSKECLFVDGYTPEQYDLDYAEGSIFYTEWEEDEDEPQRALYVVEVEPGKYGIAVEEAVPVVVEGFSAVYREVSRQIRAYKLEDTDLIELMEIVAPYETHTIAAWKAL